MLSSIDIPKRSGTYAEALHAYGVAEFLRSLGADSDVVVSIRDDGYQYRVTCEPPLDITESAQPVAIYPFVALTSAEGADKHGRVINYAEAQKQRAARKEAKKAVRPKGRRSRGKTPNTPELPGDIAESMEDLAAHDPDITLIASLNMLDKADTIKRGNQLRDLFTTITPAEIAPALGQSEDKGNLCFLGMTLGQILNPGCGKGTNRAKPDGPRRGNIEGPQIYEWFKYGGLFGQMFVHRVPVGTKTDLEVVVPIPTDIASDVAANVMKELRQGWVRGDSVKFDILAVLAYTALLVRHDPSFTRKRRANRIVSVLEIAYFKDLGGGKAVTGLYRLGIPGWFDVDGELAAKRFIECLEEHERCLRGLREDRSDHIAALLQYRDFLSSENLLELADFLATYGEHAMKSWTSSDPRDRLVRFSTDKLALIFGGNPDMNFTEIIETPGFQNIARAIRQSTISELFWKSKNQQIYEVRYGLGQELRRRARKKEDFLAALSTFTQSYNEENARVRDGKNRPRRLRPDIGRDDLAEVVRILDSTANPESVALLLVGFGFAKHPFKDDEPEDEITDRK